MKIYRPLGIDGFEQCQPVDPGGLHAIRQGANGQPRAGTWQPLPVEVVREDDDGGSFDESDAPWLGSYALILRRTAVEALTPILGAHGEFLPLACDDAELWIFNCTRVLEALDDANAVVERFPNGGLMRVATYAFVSSVIEDVDAFKITGLKNSATFVSERVVDTWRSAGLRGLEFQQVWSGGSTTTLG